MRAVDRNASPIGDGGRRATLIVAAAAALATVLVIHWGTRPLGPGLYGDGAGYLSAAESVVHSGQLRVMGAPYWSADSTAPMAQWPPGFAVAVAVPLWAGLGLLSAATLIQMLAGGLIAVLTTVLVGRPLGPVWGGGAGIAVLVTPALLGTELNVVSEPLYVAGLAGLLWAMTRRRDRPLLAGLVAAALVLIRYLGVAAIAAAALWAFASPGRWVQRARRALAAGGPGIVAYVAWGWAVRHSGGTMTSAVVDHRVGIIARAFVGAAAAWLAPSTTGAGMLHLGIKLAIVGLGAGAVLLAMPARRQSSVRTAEDSSEDAWRAAEVRQLMAAAAVLAACHLAVLLGARFVTSKVDFSSRTFAPVHYLFTVMGVTAIGLVWTASRRAGAVALAAGVVWLAAGAVATGQLLRESRTVGIDHARADERASPTIAWLRAHPTAVPIYTNEPAKIYFHLHRLARTLPWIVAPDTLQRLRETLRRQPGYVVWFAEGQPSAYVPAPLMAYAMSFGMLSTEVGLTTAARLGDGVILVADTQR
jgi:hypothetical protein